MKLYFNLKQAQRNYFLIKKSFENLCDEIEHKINELELYYKKTRCHLTIDYYKKIDQVSLDHNFEKASQIMTQFENELIDAGRPILLDQAQHIVFVKYFEFLYNKATSSQLQRRKLLEIISNL